MGRTRRCAGEIATNYPPGIFYPSYRYTGGKQVDGKTNFMLFGIGIDVIVEKTDTFTKDTKKSVVVRVPSRKISPPWRSIRFRLALRAYAPWGVRVVSQTKSRKIPTRKNLPLFFASRYEAMPDAEVQAALMKRIRE